MTVHVFGIDIGKTVFHLVGLSKEGHIVVKKRFSRKQLLMQRTFASTKGRILRVVSPRYR